MATNTNSNDNTNTGLLVIGGIVALLAILAIVFLVSASQNKEVQYVDAGPVGEAVESVGTTVENTTEEATGSIKANIPAGDADINVDIPVD